MKNQDEKSSCEYENKIQEITQLYELEKSKKDKVNVKLRVYKDKILKCAACINQLKNSRFILTNTVKEYSQNIPKWQNDIIKASKVLDNQIIQLNSENSDLQEKLKQMENQISEYKSSMHQGHESYQSLLQNHNKEIETLRIKANEFEVKNKEWLKENTKLTEELTELKILYKDLIDTQLPAKVTECKLLKSQLNDNIKNINDLTQKYTETVQMVESLTNHNKTLTDSLKHKDQNNEMIEGLNFQIKALESEKSTLVKEKLHVKDNASELEHQNKLLTDQVVEITSKLNSMTNKLETIQKESIISERKHNSEKEEVINVLKCEMMMLQEQYDRLKKEYEDLQDLNGLLREEVDTLKFSLEQPKDD